MAFWKLFFCTKLPFEAGSCNCILPETSADAMASMSATMTSTGRGAAKLCNRHDLTTMLAAGVAAPATARSNNITAPGHDHAHNCVHAHNMKRKWRKRKRKKRSRGGKRRRQRIRRRRRIGRRRRGSWRRRGGIHHCLLGESLKCSNSLETRKPVTRAWIFCHKQLQGPTRSESLS